MGQGRRKTILGSRSAGSLESADTRPATPVAAPQETGAPDTVATPNGGTDVEYVEEEEDGFRYKRRKREPGYGLPQYPVWDGAQPSGAEARAGNTPLPPDEQLLSECAQACEAELELAREVFSGEGHGTVVSAVEAALLEFQLRVEQAVVQKQIAFAQAGGGDGGDGSGSRPLSELDLRKQRLRTIVLKYQAEAAEWEAVAAASTEGMQGNVAADTEAAALTAAAETARDAERGASAAGALRQACVDAHRRLVLQVDALGALANGADDASRAALKAGHKAARTAEAEGFQSLPHVDSPHRLVRLLTGAV